MAKWITWRKKDGTFKFLFVNMYTKQTHVLTESLRADTPDDMVIDWVVNVGDPVVGDIIVLDSGKIVQFVKPGVA